MFDLPELLKQSREGLALPSGFVEFTEETTDELLRAACLTVQAVISYDNLDLDRAQGLVDQAAATYTAIDLETRDALDQKFHVQFQWTAFSLQGLILDDQGRVEETLLRHRAALAVAEKFDYQRGMVLSHCNLGLKYLFAGHTTDAVFIMLNPSVKLNADSRRRLTGMARELMAHVFFGSGLREQATEQLQLLIDQPFQLPKVERALQMVDLAMMEVALGDFEKAASIIEPLLESQNTKQVGRLDYATRIVKAIVLAAEGHRHKALELFDSITRDRSHQVKYSGLLLSDLARVEILAALGRWEELHAHQGPTSVGDNTVYRSRLLELRAEGMAQLGRWEDAVTTCRERESVRRLFDLDPRRYAELTFAKRSFGANHQSLHLSVAGIGQTATLYDTLSNDMRNRLNSVQLAMELSETADSVTDLVSHLAKLEAGLKNVRHILGSVMAYLAGLERVYAPLPSDERLDAVALSVLERFGAEAEAKNISLRIVPSPAGVVTADREMLETCLSNLVGNAIKFTPMFGEVTIGWQFQTTTSREQANRQVTIFVDDDGPGLNEDDLNHSLSRHRQPPPGPGRDGQNRAQRRRNRTSIGLAVVSRLAQAINATVKATNRTAGGSRFSFSLPGFQTDAVSEPVPFPVELKPTDRHWFDSNAANSQLDAQAVVPPSPRADRQVPTAPTGTQRVRVLLFDDDQLTLEVVGEILELAGAEVVTAATYREAFGLLVDSTSFDLFLVDFMVDGEPIGYRFARLAKKLRPYARVILVSGHDPDSIQIDHSFPVEYLRKPLRVDQLQALVAEAVDRVDSQTNRLKAQEPGAYRTKSPTAMAELVKEVADGHVLPSGWIGVDVSDPDADAIQRVDSLILAAVNEKIRGRTQKSLKLSEKAIELLDESPLDRPVSLEWNLLNNTGTVRNQLGDHEEALTIHLEALRFSRDRDFPHGEVRSAIKVAETYSVLGHREEAVATLVEATNRTGADRPARAKLFQVLGWQLMNQEATDLAIVQLRKSLQLSSSVDLDETKRTLRHLGLAYLESGEYGRLSLVINQLDRIRRTVEFSVAELANLESMRAAENLSFGFPEQALNESDTALAMFRSTTMNELSQIAIITNIVALGRLDQHQRVVDEWADPDAIPRAARSQSAHRAIARSAELVEEYEIAYRHETLANEMRRNHNRGLPHLITLAKNLSEETSSSLPESSETPDSSGTADPIALTKPINRISTITQKALEATRSARRTAEAGQVPDLDRIGILTADLGQLITGFRVDTSYRPGPRSVQK